MACPQQCVCETMMCCTYLFNGCCLSFKLLVDFKCAAPQLHRVVCRLRLIHNGCQDKHERSVQRGKNKKGRGAQSFQAVKSELWVGL